MKKVTRKVKQALSILLVAAMVITMVPQNTLAVSAEEAVETETVETTVDETKETTSETENVDETGASDEDADAEESEEGEADEETEEDEKLEEEIVEEETEEGIKKGADGFEAMTAGVNTVEYAYADEAVTITDSNEPRQTKNDTAYAFKVAAKNSYQIDSVKAYVDYVSETEHGAEVTLTDKGSGNYEIGADEVNKYDGKTIKVVIKASKITYDVTFAENADVTVTIVKDAVESALPDSRIVAVEKDGSVSFKVALTAAAEEAGKTLKSVKSGEDDVPVSDSVYTLSNITEAKTITITTEGPKKYELKFAQDRAEAKVVISNIAQSGYSASIDDVKLTTAEAKTAASGLVEKKDVTFTVGVADDSIYKVKSVTSSEGTVSTKNGVYTLKDVEGEEPVTVTVTTELDETRCNVLEFAIGEAGLEDSFTATVDTAGSYTAEDKKNKILYDAKADKAIVVTAASGYKITAIKLDGKTLETKHTEEVIEGEKEDAPVKIDGSGNWAFTVKYEAASKEKHTVTVCTDAEGLREEKTVTFFNNTAYLNLAVTTDDKIVRTKGDTYQVKEGATLLKFAITTSNNIYKPCFMVHAIGLEESDIRLTGKVAGDKETTYNYTVTANKIKGDASITISQMLAVDQYSVTVKYPTDDIASVKFIAEDGTELTPVSNSEAGTTTASVNNVIEGNKVKVVVKAKECYKIKEASTVVGDEDPKKSTVDATEYSYEVTATANTETTITTEALTKAVLLEGENIIAPNANGQYDVAYGDGKTYTAEVRLGGEPVALDDVKVATENATTKAVKNDKKADITLGAEDAGKEVTVVLTVGTGDNAKEYPIKLKLAAAPKEVAVTGVKSGKLTQNVGTVKEYPVTLNPAGAAQTLAAKVDGTGVTAVIENGKLKVTVANTAEAKADLATITIYDTTDTEKELKGGEIKVTTTQLLEKVKPTVALKSATDIDLVLTLGSKLNEDEVKALASDAKLYYKVVVTPEDTKNTNLKEAQTVYVERTAATNDETITVFKPEVTQGNGGAANFNVEVTLAQTKTADEPAKDDDFEFATAAVTAKVATKAPYFTTKLGSKKLNGGKAYTGQTDVEVAQITFDKDTTWTNLQVDDADSGLNAEVVGDKLVVGYNNPIIADPGKYDVTVKAVDDGDDNKLHVATTTVKVEIVRGIEELFITAPETLYKKDNKTKASFKADVSYNFGNPDWVPKTKKVTWTVTNTDETDLSPANAKLITVKNGTVTVDKNYVVSANKAENTFRLNVKAADYEGNTVCAWADFEITSQAAELGDVIIVNGNGHDGWTLVDVTKPVKADELDGAYAVVLKKGVAIRDYYTEEGLEAVKADAEVTFKSSNKGIVIDADGMITVAKPAKNVKITVTATDGSKAFKTITLKEVGYTAAEDIGLIINSKYGSWYNLEDKDLSFYGPKDAPFVLMPVLKHSDYGLIPTGHACTDCTVSVKNAKIVAKDVTLGFYGIIATGSPITITLQSKSLNKKVEYKLTNKSIANATANAPKLKTTDKLIGGSYYVPEEPRTQTVTYTLPKEYAGKFIQITSDYNDYYKNDKNELRYNAFEYACDEIGTIVRVNSAGQVTLTFKAVDYYYTNIPAGSYKLNYLVGSYDIDGNFVAETKPGSVTLKAVAQKAVKAKLNTSYTMSLKEGARVGLALNNKNAKLNASNLQNANIKGQENEFTTYFELDGNYLKLKDTLSPEQLEYIISNAAKNDLTGWVTYSYTDGRGDYQGEGEAQIKVSFKDLVQKYSLSKATVLSNATSATVTAYAGKETTDIAYVLVTDGEFTAEADNDNSSTITLTRNGTWKKSNEVTLRILPKDSYYVAKVTDVKADATKFAEAMNTYGIEVKTTITAKDFESTTGKITINSKDAAQTFTAKELDVDYEVVDKKGYYVVEVPYTTTVESVAEFTVDAVNDADKAMFKVTVDKANKKLVVKLDKAALAENVKKTKDTGVVYGQKRKVEFTLTFADKAAAEKIKLNLTLPKEVTANYESVIKAVQKALRDVEEGVYYKGIVDKEEVAEINVSYVKDLISALVPADSDTKLIVSVADTENDVKLPTSGVSGSVKVKVTLTDLTKDATSANTELNLTLAKLDKAPYELYSALTSYLSGLDNHVSNNTTYEEIVKGARDAIEITKYPNLRLVLENFNKEEATLNNSGSIRGVFYIIDIYDEYDIGASLNASIPRIKNLYETNSAITNGWSDLSSSNVTLLKNVKQADGKDAVMNWVKSYINNDAISVAWKQVEGKDVFGYVASSSKATGTVYGTIILTAEGEDPVEIKLSEKDSAAVVARRETLDEVDTAVGNAVNAVVVSNSTTKDDYVNAVKAVIENPSFTITWKEDKFEKTDATTSKAGSINATLVLSDADNAEAAAKEYMINETIDMLQQKTLAEAQAAGAEALTALAVSNSITQANVLDEVIGAVNLKYATVTWKQVAKDKDKPTVLSDDFEKVDATASNDGSIKGTIVITLDDETVEVQVNLTIPKTGLGS